MRLFESEMHIRYNVNVVPKFPGMIKVAGTGGTYDWEEQEAKNYSNAHCTQADFLPFSFHAAYHNTSFFTLKQRYY